jgi:hypothetical protein
VFSLSISFVQVIAFSFATNFDELWGHLKGRDMSSQIQMISCVFFSHEHCPQFIQRQILFWFMFNLLKCPFVI